MANNGRQPKHPINLTGPDLKPRGVLNSLTPNADAGRAQPLHYVTHSRKREPCRVLLQGDTGGGGKGVVAGVHSTVVPRWRRGEERDVMCDPWKTKPREFHPFSSSFTSVSPATTSFPVSANLLLPVNVTRSAARGRSCTGSDEISTNLFCYRILIRFAPSPPPPHWKPRSKFRLNKRALWNYDRNGTLFKGTLNNYLKNRIVDLK